MAIKILKKPKVASPPVVPVVHGFKEWNPMLAAEGVLGKLTYPLIGMPKHNGVRGINQDSVLVARSLKPIPNKHTRATFSGSALCGLDGELVVGDPYDEEVFSISTSGIREANGRPDVRWFVFDWFHPSLSFEKRLVLRDRTVAEAGNPLVELIEWKFLHSDEELVAYSDWALSIGLEGLVLRDPRKPYKMGRSTESEQGFMRFCPWLRDEGIIVAIHEGEVNNNPSVKNELGYLKKSSHKENKVGSGRAGSVTVLWKDGIEFNMPVPTVKLQEDVWKNKGNYLQMAVKFKFKPPVKIGGRPRFPQWEGLRMPEDM